jgi:murein DD-endopeptidase MepM/ murein hydrolase activator NlpD
LTRISVTVTLVVLVGAGATVVAKDTYGRAGNFLSAHHSEGRNVDNAASPQAKDAARQRSRTVARASENGAFEMARKEATQQLDRTKAVQRADRHQRGALSWVLPVRGYHLSARFGQNGDKWASFHHGLDFAAPDGTPIHAVGAGEIIDVTRGDPAYGNYIKIRHDNGTVTLYAHMSAFERTSGSVNAGDVIGYVGSTGNATGPHLHLEVRPDNGGLSSSIDPFPWLSSKGLYP